ncbi:hypothetical protein LINPERHAP1_LOCUS6878 [Linum perenne]
MSSSPNSPSISDDWRMAWSNECVICRVFQKTCGGKKIHISGITRFGELGHHSTMLPPLMESPSAYFPLFSSSHYNSQFPSPNFGQYNDNSLLLRALMERQAGGAGARAGAGAGSLNLMKQNFSVSEMNT